MEPTDSGSEKPSATPGAKRKLPTSTIVAVAALVIVLVLAAASAFVAVKQARLLTASIAQVNSQGEEIGHLKTALKTEMAAVDTTQKNTKDIIEAVKTTNQQVTLLRNDLDLVASRYVSAEALKKVSDAVVTLSDAVKQNNEINLSTRRDFAKIASYVSDSLYPAVISLGKNLGALDRKLTTLSAPTPVGYLEPQKPAPTASSLQPAAGPGPGANQTTATPVPAPAEPHQAPPVVIVDSPGVPLAQTARQETGQK